MRVDPLAGIAVAGHGKHDLGFDLVQPVAGPRRPEIGRARGPDRSYGRRSEIECDGFDVVGDDAGDAIAGADIARSERLHHDRNQIVQTLARQRAPGAVVTMCDQRETVIGLDQKVFGVVESCLREEPRPANVGVEANGASAFVTEDAKEIP